MEYKCPKLNRKKYAMKKISLVNVVKTKAIDAKERLLFVRRGRA
jgi:hypothetical protein